MQGGSVMGQNRQVMGEPSGEGRFPVQSQGSEGVRGDRIQLTLWLHSPLKKSSELRSTHMPKRIFKAQLKPEQQANRTFPRMIEPSSAPTAIKDTRKDNAT